MAQINKPNEYFNTKLYTGDDTNNREISLGLTPDLTWIKARNVAYGHILFDRIRGLGFSLNSNNTNADRNVGSEFGWSNSGCTTDSFTVDRGSNESLNESGRPMVAWNWKANGTGSANTDGSISSTVSASTTSGFSIVTYDGTGSAGATVGHGLGVAPSMILAKKMDGAASNWAVYHKSLGATKYLILNSTTASVTSNTRWNNVEPTSSVFTVGSSGDVNNNGETVVAYCFAEKKGYSKFGSYTGNGSTDGPFIYTGFKPAWVMCKVTSATDSWVVYDNKRDTFNVTEQILRPNTSGAEGTESGAKMDLLSNGFKLRGSGGGLGQTNSSGASYIYMAFAENPLVGTNNIPATAR
jgi:hypothetical protein